MRGIDAAVERAMGCAVRSRSGLSGGCIAEVWRADLADGRRVVVKRGGSTLETEAWMLESLAARSALPVPRVLHTEPALLVMEFVEGESRFDSAAQRHAAELLASLHGISSLQFGLERDTLIGPLRQPNAWTVSWVEFFRDQRLLAMAQVAAEAGALPEATHERVRRLAAELGRLIDEPRQPSLVHGDVWSTNVLAAGGRITAFLDPAIYFGHAEAELAYITLFSTFGDAFFERYNERRPIRAGFFESRRDVYNLYPLLVHVRLFGGGYVAQLESVLTRLGF